MKTVYKPLKMNAIIGVSSFIFFSMLFFSSCVNNDKKEYANKNRLILNKKKWIIPRFKTKKSIDKREFDVPDELIEQIKRVKKIYPTYGYVFPKITNITKKGSSQSISNFLGRLLGGGIQTLRKIYVSDLIDRGTNANERKKISHIMGHSVKTQILNYSKFSDVLHSNNKELNDAIYNFKEKYGKDELIKLLNSSQNK
jgi:integrase